MKKAIFLASVMMTNILGFTQTFDWAKTGGSWAYDYAYGIATDVNGNNIITGYFQDTAYFGSNMIVSAGDNDMFLAKYDNMGNCVWAKQAGSALAPDGGYAVALDVSGNCFVTGYYIDTIDFGPQQLLPLGWDDMFIAKYDGNGNFIWAKRYGGNSNDDGKSIDIDANGNICVSGYFWTTAAFDSYNLVSAGWGDVFTAKFDPSGTCQWAQKGGGAGDDQGLAVCSDNAGNIFSTGFFKSTATFGTNTLNSAGVEDIFIVKYNASGALQWIKQAGSSGTDIGYGIASDASGNCYVTGVFNGTVTFGNFTLTSTGGNDQFIVKIDPAGNYVWAINDGGVLNDAGLDIITDDAGYLYTTGSFEGFATFGSVEINTFGIGDIFVSCYSTDSIFQWVKQAGGSNQDEGNGIGVDTSGNCYVTGDYMSYTATFDTYQINNTGFVDGFIAKIGPPDQPPNALFSTANTSICEGDCISFTDNSSGAPSSWNWSFQGGNPSTSTAQNPSGICYDTAGVYDVTLIVQNGFGIDTLIQSAYITVDSCTGIAESQFIRHIKLFPNPTHDNITIEIDVPLANIRLSLTDALGRTFYSSMLSSPAQITLDCSYLPKGIYLLQIQTPHGLFNKKWVVE